MLSKKMIKKYLYQLVEPSRFFLLTSLIFGSIIMFAVPSLWGFDETSHFSRVYMLSEGKFLPSQDSEMPKSFNKVAWYAIADIGEEKQQDIFLRKDINNFPEYQKLLQEKFSKDKEAAINPAGYSVLAYPLSVLAVALTHPFNLSIGTTVSIARFAGLITFIVLVYLSLVILKKNNFKKTQWIVICISLLPTTLFQAATLSADTIVNGAAVLFIVLLIVALKFQKNGGTIPKEYLTSLLLLAILIPLVKVNYIFLSVCIIFLSTHQLGGKKTRIVLKSIIIVGSLLLSLYLTYGLAPKIDGHQISPRPDGQVVNQIAQAEFVFHHPIHFVGAIFKSIIFYGDAYIREMTTVLAWNYVSLPLLFTILCVISLLFAAFYARGELMFMRKHFNYMFLLAVGSIGSIFLALYLAFTPVGKLLVDGVQGRYMIPLAMPVVVVIATNVNIGISSRERTIKSIFMCLTTIILLGAVIYYIKSTY